MTTLVRDLPYYGETWTHSGTAVGPNDWLADTDTSTEIVLSNNLDDVIGGHFGVGTDPINWPTDIPAGYTLTDLQHVVIAYSEAGGTIGVDTSGWGYTPPPETWPFIILTSSFRGGTLEIDHLPVGGYAGETLGRFSDLGAVSTGEGYDHMRIDTWTTFSPVHVAYWALRVTYTSTEPTSTVAPPLRLTNRSDVFASAPSLTRSGVSRQGGNRVTGYL